MVAEGQRGFEVTSISATEFRQIAELRELLEGHAIEAVVQIRRPRLGGLRGLGPSQAGGHGAVDAGRRQIEDRDLEAVRLAVSPRADLGLRLARCCSTRMSAAYDKYLRYQMLAVVFRGEIAAVEHRELMDAALRRDAAKARKSAAHPHP